VLSYAAAELAMEMRVKGKLLLDFSYELWLVSGLKEVCTCLSN